MRVAEAMASEPDVTLIGVAGRHAMCRSNRGRRRCRSRICPSAGRCCTTCGLRREVAEGRTGHRTDRRRPRDDDDPVRDRRADGGHGARPGLPPRSVAIHPAGQQRLPAQPRRIRRRARSRAVQQPGDDGRLLAAGSWPTVCASCRSASRRRRPTPTRSPGCAPLYGLPERYLLFVGTVEPRKNLRGLAEAVALPRRTLPLVVAGAEGWGDVAIPRAATSASSASCRPRDLGGLYAGAEVFCYPSEREGYGLPVLEAMVQGTPVVTSRGTATEEAAGGAAVLVDPHDPPTSPAASPRRAPAATCWPTDGVGPRRSATWQRDGAADRRRVPGAVLMVDPAVAVNLLWCVPGDVGGSEEYLVRQLLGLAEAARDLRSTLYVVDGFAAAHPDLAELFPTVVAPFEGRVARAAHRRRGDLAPPARHRRRPAPPRRRHGAAGRRAPVRADDPRPAVPHVPGALQPDSSGRTSAAMIGRSARRAAHGRRAHRVRAHLGDRCVRGRSARVVVVPHGFEPALLPRHHSGGGAARPLRARRRAGRRLPGGHPPAQEPHVPHRSAGDAAGPIRTCGWSSSAEAAPRRAIVARATDPRSAVSAACRAADRNGLVEHGRRNGVPEPLRGLRRSVDRGDGARHAGDRQRLDVHPGDRRRCRARPAARPRRVGRCARRSTATGDDDRRRVRAGTAFTARALRGRRWREAYTAALERS